MCKDKINNVTDLSSIDGENGVFDTYEKYSLIHKLYKQLQYYSNTIDYDDIELVYEEQYNYPIIILYNCDFLPDFKHNQSIAEVVREHNCSIIKTNNNILIL